MHFRDMRRRGMRWHGMRWRGMHRQGLRRRGMRRRGMHRSQRGMRRKGTHALSVSKGVNAIVVCSVRLCAVGLKKGMRCQVMHCRGMCYRSKNWYAQWGMQAWGYLHRGGICAVGVCAPQGMCAMGVCAPWRYACRGGMRRRDMHCQGTCCQSQKGYASSGYA